ncbi:MAG: hypothetical protein ACRD0U_14820 [Acidimicrobiales bacterium]
MSLTGDQPASPGPLLPPVPRPRSRLGVILIVVLLLGAALGAYWTLSSWLRDSYGSVCEVTTAGIEERERMGAEPDQGEADEVEVGDRYESDAGCVPRDIVVEK